MGAVHVVERPAQYPGHTVWGKTSGPVAYMGELVRGKGLAAGVSIYLTEGEVNEARAAFGFPSKEAFADLAEELSAAQQRCADLEQQLAKAVEHQVKVVPIGDVRQAVDERLEELATPPPEPKESHASR